MVLCYEVNVMVKFNKDLRIEQALEDRWHDRKNNPCIWWQGEWWSYARLTALADDCEIKLKNAGFGVGQRVALLLPNSPVVTAIAIACWRLGGAVAPLNARTGAANLLSTIKMLDVNCLIMTPEGVKKAEGMNEDIPLVSVAPEGPLPEWTGRIGTPEDDKTAVIFSTSGTSGLPKAVICTHSNILANSLSIFDDLPDFFVEDTNFLNVLPNFHTFGFNVANMMPLILGFRQAMVANFVPVENTIKAIEEAGVNKVIGVPAVMAFILGALEKRNHKIEGIQHVVTGGDKLNILMEERCKKYLGVGIVEGYGLTECSPVVSFNLSKGRRKLGTVGPAFSGYELQIHDRDGKLLDIHDEGVLWIKGPSVVPSYFRDPKNTAERFHDGWFNTGDVVRIDEDGYITIIDRATDIIIVSGFNVYPQEVEAVLATHEAVQQAVCVGEKNKLVGELVKAFIILKEGHTATPKELMNYCKERLAHYKVPRKIGFVTSYPISPAGKILRRVLREQKIEKAEE